MSNLQRLALIFGGRSAEHEVSVTSALGVMREVDTRRFEVVPVGITRGGEWLTPEETRDRLNSVEAGETRSLGDEHGRGVFSHARILELLAATDVVFPIVHGKFGEDGSLQGLLELADIPYVGSGVAASGVGMDKVLMRAAFAHAGITQPRYLVLRDGEARDPSDATVRSLETEIGYPCFVKPANGGSSIGITKVRSREDLHSSISTAVRHDRKVLIEEAIDGRELECAVLGNADPQTSPLGEIRSHAEFYTYEAKYLDNTADLIVPADLPADRTTAIQECATRAFQAIDCAGLARVDFLLPNDDEARILEVNTLPGFTPISMYPRLWQEGGIDYGELITRLVELGIERYEESRNRV